MRRTKIVATVGPASSNTETIMRMLEAGMDIARLNFSHGTHESHARTIAMLRECADRLDRPLALLQDLQGPKIRTGPLEGKQPVVLEKGERFTITTREVAGNARQVSTTYEALPRDVQRGDHILVSDGLIELVVIDTSDNEVETRVVFGGTLNESQGINLPGVNISSPSLTSKDVTDLEFGLSQGVDYVALSFVRRATDIVEAKSHIAARGKEVPVIAKIEKPEALDDLQAILKAADGVMVARGDLGVEIAAERVPLVQKTLIEGANNVGIPVITATQMLDSMIRNPRPTRAESSDVANAIIDGTDAVMLSGETAAGRFPVEAIQMMARIAMATEASGRYRKYEPDLSLVPARDIPNAISTAANAIVGALCVKAIIAFTQSGTTARLVSRQRPDVPIMAFTPFEEVYHRLNLLWGVVPFFCPYNESMSYLINYAVHTLLKLKLISPGEMIAITGGYPIAARGITNFLHIFEVVEPA